MNIKKYLMVFVIFLLISSCCMHTVHANNSPSFKINAEQIYDSPFSDGISTSENTANGTLISTKGPLSSIFRISDIYFIDGGSPLKLMIIQKLIDNIPQIIIPRIPIKLDDVTFSIKYTRNIPQLPFLNRFSYETQIDEDGEITVYTEKHTIIVTGFTGTFTFYRKKPILLYPAYFSFYGSCEDYILVT
ncbi:MAG: hypothetical protein R6V50_04490 [Thermoplasmatota archaeon]